MYQDAGSGSHCNGETIRLYNVLRNENSKRARGKTPSSELRSYQGYGFLSQITIQEFVNLDILGW